MANQQITAFNALQPSIVRTIREAFDDAVSEIERRRGNGAPPVPDGLRAALARRLVDLARHGECERESLRREALSNFPV